LPGGKGFRAMNSGDRPKTTLLPPGLSSLMVRLGRSDVAEELPGVLLEDLVESTQAAVGALFLADVTAREVAAFPRRAVVGVQPGLQDRVALAPNIARELGATRELVHLGGPRSQRGAGRIFAPAARRLRSGLAIGVWESERCLAVFALGFKVEPPPEGAADLLEAFAEAASAGLDRRLLRLELQASELRFRALMDGAADAITLYDPIRDVVVDCNPAAEALFGRHRSAILGTSPGEVLSFLRTTSLSELLPLPRNGVLEDEDGSERPFEVTSRLIELDGRPMLLSIFRDQGDRLRSEAELRASQERYALAVEGAHGGVWDWDVADGIVYYSPRWKALLGYDDHEVGDTPGEWFRRVHPADLERMRAAIADHLEGDSPYFEDEHRIRRKDGTWTWVLARGRAIREEGLASRMAGSIVDVTQRKLVEERLLRAAFRDALTGLPNRALFMDRLSQVVARCRRHPDAYFAVLVLDVDRFKVVNDSLGHGLGDELLTGIARRLERCVRPSDTVARLGGDEFTVLLNEVSGVRGATRFAERVQAELVRPFRIGGQEVFTTVSIGVALGDKSTEDAQTLLRNADMAMYQAKGNGKARHEVFDHVMHARALEQLALETDLRKGLQREEFRLHFQPLVRLSDRKLRSFEALVRWQHPERGLLPPGQFLQTAEDTGLIVPLGSWVLRNACTVLARWRAAGHNELSISVNLAGRQLEQPDLVQEVAEVLQQTGVPPSSLVLEVTENVVMKHGDVATATLEELKRLGVRLHMDDFGTGLASLAYLRRFPLDTLKIDRSFVSRMTEDPQDEEIVRTIVTLGRNLNLGVIAEGIETDAQLERLKELGCDLGQGYFLARPMPEADAGRWVEQELG
jgi:diguanylate cyclase (GGDEF)-like protein/PAS domain S-box-containing protein